MSEEKKLSKDELMEEFLRMFARWGGLVGKEMQAYEQLKSLIESSAQEPKTAIRITFDDKGNIIGIPYRLQSDEEFRMKIDDKGKIHLRYEGKLLEDAEKFYEKHGDEYDRKTMKLVKIIGTWTGMDDVRFALLKGFIKTLTGTKEPSEAEIEEFVERQIKGFKLLYLNCDDLFSRFLNNLQSWRLKRLLKEYDSLREGKEE